MVNLVETVTLPRLLARQELTSLLETFVPLAPHGGWAVLQANAQLYARAGQWPEADLAELLGALADAARAGPGAVAPVAVAPVAVAPVAVAPVAVAPVAAAAATPAPGHEAAPVDVRARPPENLPASLAQSAPEGALPQDALERAPEGVLPGAVFQAAGCRVYRLRAGGHAVGLLAARAASPEVEHALCQSLTLLLALALEKRLVVNETLERYREINLLYRVAETINTCLDPAPIPELVLDESRHAIAAEAGFVLMASNETEDVQAVTASFGLPPGGELDAFVRLTLARIPDPARSVILTGLPGLFTPGDWEALLWAPLKTPERVWGGVLLARRAGQPPFAASAEKLLAALADQAALALQNAWLYRAATVYAQQLAILNEVSRSVTSTLDLDSVLELIMNKTLEILSAEAGSLVLVEGVQRDLVFRVTRGAHAEQVIGLRLPWGTGLTGQVAAEGKLLISNNVRADPRWQGQLDDAGFMRAMMILPLVSRGRVIGVLTVINKRGSAGFTPDDVTLISAFADQAAIALENARLHLAALEKERLEHELHLASQVQARLIPRTTPRLPGWDFAAWWQPVREVSGDFYDFIPRGAQLGLVIADVSDKGMHAALFMTLARSIVRATTALPRPPAESLTDANRLLCPDATNGMFVTLFYAQLDPRTRELVYVNGGHNPPLLYRAASGELLELARTGIMLGFDEDWPYEQRALRLEPGDLLVLYTDGVTEAMNARRDLFGEERLKRLVLARSQAGAAEILQAVRDALDDYMGATAPADDITVVVVKCL